MLPQIKQVAKKHNLKTYKAKDFKKIIKLLGVFVLMVSCTNKKGRLLYDSIDTVKDMKEWMIQDKEYGIVDEKYADYYIEYLGEVEKKLTEIYGI